MVIPIPARRSSKGPPTTAGGYHWCEVIFSRVKLPSVEPFKGKDMPFSAFSSELAA